MTRRRRAVIHIGTHKTGTSAFQAALVASRDLLEAGGVHLVADVDSGQCHSLPDEILRKTLQYPHRSINPDMALRQAKRTARQWLRTQFAGSQPVTIASHEALSFARTTREVRRMRRLLGGRSVTVVVVVRQPESFLRSWAAQIQSMGYASESPYRASFRYVEPDSWLADWATLVSVYAKVFGRRAVTVLQYEDLVEADGSATVGLWRACGLPDGARPQSLASWANVTADKPAPPPPFAHRIRVFERPGPDASSAGHLG